MELAVAALIATYRRPRELARLLASLGKIERGLALVVVVDNAGCAETRALVEAAPFPTQLVVPGENLGCGGGLRLAGETALRLVGDHCTHLLVLDDDAVLAPDTLDLLAAAMEAAHAAAACPLVLAPGGALGWTPGLADRRAHHLAETLPTVADFRAQLGTAPLPLVWTQGICLLVTRRAITAVGLHRDDFWMRGEDLEFSLRLSARHRLVVVPAAVVEHLPPPPDGAVSRDGEYLKHAAMLQNIAFLSLRLAYGRRIAWTLPANVWRFLRAWGPRALPDALRAFCRGALRGEPAGRGTGRTFQKRLSHFAAAVQGRFARQFSMTVPRFNVLGVSVSAMNLRLATEAVLDALRARRKGYICVTGVHGVTEAQNDPAFRRILNASFLNTTDGMPLVWLGKYHVGGDVDRVYGPDLMLEIFAATQAATFRHFFYGGAPGVAEELKAKLEARFAGVSICGTYCPPFRPLNAQEQAELTALVAEKKPDVIWVGLSTPKQERFMAEWLPRLDTTLMFGVGAAFDFHAGRVRQAPRWIQRSGFEWLYRLCCEPRRLARRYLVNNPLFLWRIAGQLTGWRKYPLEERPAP